LQRLADEVQRIARTLADLIGNETPPLRGVSDAMIGFRAEPFGDAVPPSVITANDVRAIIRLRRMRDRYFRSDLFADPAWDMLLDLMAARLEQIQVAVSSLCIAAAVPPTTALRWIKTLSENGMFVRVADPEDGRRVFIALSDGAAAGMTAYLTMAKAHGSLAV
jgi:DNA-binding MarR family transcriptional regulator